MRLRPLSLAWIIGPCLILGLSCRTETPLDTTGSLDIPAGLAPYLESVTWGRLGGEFPGVRFQKIREGCYLLKMEQKIDQEEGIQQDDWQIRLTPAFAPSFHWSPHLTPEEGHIVDQHAFRSPALIAKNEDRVLAAVPDLDIMLEGTPVRWYMDLDAEDNRLTFGMSDYEVVSGLFFTRKPGALYPAGRVEFGIYLVVSSDPEDISNPWRKPLAMLWENWGKPLYETGQPLEPNLEPYVQHTYSWAFESWNESVWQEFEWNGRRVGAPVFIVNVTQSPNYPGEVNEREFRSIWNQAWFSSLRSASGLFRYAKRTDQKDLLSKARLTKELALAAPVNAGFFDTVIATEMESIDIEGQPHRRSRGWETAFWGNSNRNPVNRPPNQPRNRDPGIAPYHVLDMSWTALLMLRWYEELEGDDGRLLSFARTYAESLLTLQDHEGFFPAWLDKTTLKPLGILDRSPETSMSVTFLLRLGEVTGEERYQSAALRALDAVVREIVPVGRWEDFETYWSSSSYGSGDLIGRKMPRNNMFKQCNFSIFWTAEALLEAYKTTGENAYLEVGERVLDELLMTQASWQPPYMYVPVLGGFGVMNCDGEWLDSRQSLFAELIVRYGLELDREEYVERGLAALRASFIMMYCPENPEAKAQWEKRHPFFGPEDYGFTMENYGHGGRTSPEGEGMGVFTIYDWGNGAAAEAYNRMIDHLGPDLVLGRK
jgi:hypothetical protein